MLLNGQDLSAAWCRQVQDGSRVLSAWWLTYDAGAHHPVLNRPPDSVFDVDDLRLSVSLRGRGVSAECLHDDLIALRAGERTAVIHTAPAGFLGHSAGWDLVRGDGEVAAEAVLHTGSRRRVDFHDAALRLGFGLELLGAGDSPREAVVSCKSAGAVVEWSWDGLALSTPAAATPFGGR